MDILNQVTPLLGTYSANLIGALAVLIIGWLVAVVVSSLVHKALRRTKVDAKIASCLMGEEKAKTVEMGRWIASIVYYLILIFVLVAFFQILGLTIITEPLNRLLIKVFEFAPRLLGAVILVVIAWVVATVLKHIVFRTLSAARFDERFVSRADIEKKEDALLAKNISDGVYWLVLLLFLPLVLDALALQGLLDPVQAMINEILVFLPNIFGAAVILLVGWVIARILRRIVTNLSAAFGADRLSEKVGLDRVLGEQKLSGLLGLVVYILVLLPVLIAAIEALDMAAITAPASNLLNTVLNAIPVIFAAVLVLAITYVVGRLVAELITNMLTGMGFNTIMARLGIGKEPSEGKRTPSEMAGYLVLVALMALAAIEASSLLGFFLLADLLSMFVVFASQVIMGLIIFAIGIYLANLAYRVVMDSGLSQAGLLAAAAKGAILILAGAMGLRQMGLANDIINLAFGLLLGAVAVAVALAFGLGGREVASRELEGWTKSLKSRK